MPLNSDAVTDEQKKLVALSGRVSLADIAVKLELKFPYLISARLKTAKRIGEREGYESYKAELEEVCDGLAQFDDIRKFMAHGRLWPRTIARSVV